jgi:hypothetical protein
VKTRTDIAMLLGISKKQLNNLLFTNQIRLPEHVGKKGTCMLYEDEDVEEYINSDPLSNKYEWVPDESVYTGLDMEMAQAFIRKAMIIDEDTPYSERPPVTKSGKTTSVRVQARDVIYTRQVDPYVNIDAGMDYVLDVYGDGRIYWI